MSNQYCFLLDVNTLEQLLNARSDVRVGGLAVALRRDQLKEKFFHSTLFIDRPPVFCTRTNANFYSCDTSMRTP